MLCTYLYIHIYIHTCINSAIQSHSHTHKKIPQHSQSLGSRAQPPSPSVRNTVQPQQVQTAVFISAELSRVAIRLYRCVRTGAHRPTRRTYIGCFLTTTTTTTATATAAPRYVRACVCACVCIPRSIGSTAQRNEGSQPPPGWTMGRVGLVSTNG